MEEGSKFLQGQTTEGLAAGRKREGGAGLKEDGRKGPG